MNDHCAISPPWRSPGSQSAGSCLDRLARRVICRQLSRMTQGQLLVEDGSSRERYGGQDALQASIRIHRSRFFRLALSGGTLSVAESYLRGDWDCDDLTALFRIFVRNRPVTEKLDSACAAVVGYGQRLWHWWHANTRARSKRNIAAHYDLGNEFYELWLDETMAYSCGIFPHARASLAEASREKFDRMCRLAELRPEDKLLEIGTGWGGLAIHAAENYGCRVTTTTISQRQYEYAKRRFEATPSAGRISLLKQDYRDLRGQYDKLLSIEMIEAVGNRYLPVFFRKCGELLRSEGSLVLQAIVMPERGYERYLRSVDFIQRYVFPGGCLPSLGAMLTAAGNSTDLRFVGAEDFAPHYAETLRRWRAAFDRNIDQVRGLGFSEEFSRLWKYYLCYCEAAFEERAIGLLQLRFDKPAAHRRGNQTPKSVGETLSRQPGSWTPRAEPFAPTSR